MPKRLPSALYPAQAGSGPRKPLIAQAFHRPFETSISTRRGRIDKGDFDSHFAAMLSSGSLTSIARALFLAVVGFVIASSGAFAHGGTSSAISGQPVAQVQTTAEQDARLAIAQLTKVLTVAVAPGDRSERADRPGGEPCSDEAPGGHLPGGCCKVACHSALAAFTPEPAGTSNPTSQYVAGLGDTLVGQSGACTERPPKRG